MAGGVAELVDALEGYSADFKTVQFGSVLGIVQNEGSNPSAPTNQFKLYESNFYN